MNIDDIPSLLGLCERALKDLKSYDAGVNYESLQIYSTFQTIVIPLLNGDEIIPELRQAIPSIELFELKKSIFKLRNGNSFSLRTAESTYSPAIARIKAALQTFEKKNSTLTKNKTGPWTVFYSWQSTLPNSTNRALIRTCLDKAVLAINTEMNVEDSFRVDSDTSGRPGSPKIFDTILDKIEKCDIFVADVSLVANKQANSNVMVELGYALAKKGPDAIVMICNTAYGEIGHLPFDLGFNRVIPYSCAEDQQDKASVRSALTPKLKAALSGIFKHSP